VREEARAAGADFSRKSCWITPPGKQYALDLLLAHKLLHPRDHVKCAAITLRTIPSCAKRFVPRSPRSPSPSECTSVRFARMARAEKPRLEGGEDGFGGNHARAVAR